jgi:hypothetical protein
VIKTTSIIISADDVPETWIFEHYLSIPEKLDGREVRMTSVFNPKERTPSMYLYLGKDKKYKFKDFSSGNGGSAIDLVKYLYGVNYGDAMNMIKGDYKKFIDGSSYRSIEYKETLKYKVVDYNGRKWTNLDAKYWMSYGIGSKTLEKYNVMPLEDYTMTNGEKQFKVSGPYIYGYLRKDGLIYKVYQPKCQSKKFMKVRSYIQGVEQLSYEKPNLVILSSLKDLMSFEQLKFKTIECIAPDSENSMIPESLMWDLISKYETVITIFDNDEAGMKAVSRYSEKYGINGFVLDLEKDISDSVSRHGKDFVKNELVPLLTECIHTCRRCPESSTSV